MNRTLALIRALVAACLATSGVAFAQERPWTPLPSPVSATCPGGLCQPQGLEAFFAALDRGGPVQIVQFGDSHTAGGHIPDSLQWRLAARFPRGDIRLSPYARVGDTLSGLQAREPVLDGDGPAPDLIVLAYGTNEGFDDLLDAVVYERLLRGQLGRLRTRFPTASILILGAPDAMRGEGGGSCPGDPEGRWRSPDMLSVVRDVQHRVAADTGVAFWDWRGRMGGDCSAHALTLGPEPLMRGDHVHFTGAGGDWIGSLLAADIVAAHGRGGR